MIRHQDNIMSVLLMPDADIPLDRWYALYYAWHACGAIYVSGTYRDMLSTSVIWC